MSSPPAVSYNVVRSRWYFFAIAMFGALAWLGCGLFAMQQESIGSRGLVVGLCLLSQALAGYGWYRSPTGQLRWDGECWHWSGFSDGCTQYVQCIVDLQSRMLVQTHAHDGHTAWLWLAASTGSKTTWQSLRRALVHGESLVQGESFSPL